MKNLVILLTLSVLVLGINYTITVVGPSGNYTAKLYNTTLEIGNKTITIPKAQYTYISNKTYTVYLVSYTDPNCTTIALPNKPEFWVGCSKGSEFTVVAVKDPQARVVCKDNRNREVNPEEKESDYAIYKTKALSIECKSELSAVVTMPTQFVAVLAGVYTALFGAMAVFAFVLLKRSFK